MQKCVMVSLFVGLVMSFAAMNAPRAEASVWGDLIKQAEQMERDSAYEGVLTYPKYAGLAEHFATYAPLNRVCEFNDYYYTGQRNRARRVLRNWYGW